MARTAITKRFDGVAAAARRSLRGSLAMVVLAWTLTILPVRSPAAQGFLLGVSLCLGVYGFCMAYGYLQRSRGKSSLAAVSSILGGGAAVYTTVLVLGQYAGAVAT